MRKEFVIPLPGGGSLVSGRRTLIMGVVNVTPDSFSDGGAYLQADAAIRHALKLQQQGADIIDIGGESTRPGAEPVTAATELARVIPVIEGLKGKLGIPISIDTYKAEVAREAIKAGAQIVNDVSGLRFDPKIADVVRQTDAALIIMHMRGTPQTMHLLNPSSDLIGEVAEGLKTSIDVALRAGVSYEKIIIDPGIGFGKNAEENLRLINNLHAFADFDRPILVGPSRKSFIGRILNKPPDERLYGTLAAVAVAILRGAHMVRVHDVAATGELVRVVDSILAERIV